MPEDECELKYPETFPLSCMTTIIDISLKREARTRLKELVLHSTNIILYLAGVMLPEDADDEVTPIGGAILLNDHAAHGCLKALEDIADEPKIVGSRSVAILPILPLIALAIQLLRLYLKNRK